MKIWLLISLVFAHDYKCSVVHGICSSSIVYFLNGYIEQPFVCWHPSVNGSDLCMKPTIGSEGFYSVEEYPLVNGVKRHWVVVDCDGFRDPNNSESWHVFTCAI